MGVFNSPLATDDLMARAGTIASRQCGRFFSRPDISEWERTGFALQSVRVPLTLFRTASQARVAHRVRLAAPELPLAGPDANACSEFESLFFSNSKNKKPRFREAFSFWKMAEKEGFEPS